MSVGFIHITKCGGTDFKEKMKHTKDIDFFDYHCGTSKYFTKRRFIPCFTIIREPIERFISLFKYNTLGSDIYEKNNSIYDINEFIGEMIKNGDYTRKFERGWQFKKQVEWLDGGDSSRTYLLQYQENNDENIALILQELFNITSFSVSDKKTNISLSKQGDIELNCLISNENLEFLKIFYKEDMELYYNLSNKLSKIDSKYISLEDLLRT